MASDQENVIKSKLLDLFKGAATVAGGGAVLLTVAGFLVLRSHAAVLGLTNVLHHSIAEYADEGGAFLLTVLLWGIPTLVVTRPAFWVVLLGLAFYIYLDGVPVVQRRVREWLTLRGRIELWPFALAAAALAAGFAVERLLPSPKAVDLLFATGNQSEIALRATETGMQRLEADFLAALLATLSAGVLIFLAWRSLPVRRGGFFSAGRILLIGLAILLSLLLPVQYGQTILSNDFHRVESYVLASEVQQSLPASEEVWLLGRSSEDFVFYFRDSFTVSLITKDSVKQVSVGERRNVFAPASP